MERHRHCKQLLVIFHANNSYNCYNSITTHSYKKTTGKTIVNEIFHQGYTGGFPTILKTRKTVYEVMFFDM